MAIFFLLELGVFIYLLSSKDYASELFDQAWERATLEMKNELQESVSFLFFQWNLSFLIQFVSFFKIYKKKSTISFNVVDLKVLQIVQVKIVKKLGQEVVK